MEVWRVQEEVLFFQKPADPKSNLTLTVAFNSKMLLELKIITRNVETSKWRIKNIDPTFVQL
jgi:hypothetical protein